MEEMEERCEWRRMQRRTERWAEKDRAVEVLPSRSPRILQTMVSDGPTKPNVGQIMHIPGSAGGGRFESRRERRIDGTLRKTGIADDS